MKQPATVAQLRRLIQSAGWDEIIPVFNEIDPRQIDFATAESLVARMKRDTQVLQSGQIASAADKIRLRRNLEVMEEKLAAIDKRTGRNIYPE